MYVCMHAQNHAGIIRMTLALVSSKTACSPFQASRAGEQIRDRRSAIDLANKSKASRGGAGKALNIEPARIR